MKKLTITQIILRIVSIIILAEIGIMMALMFRSFELGPYEIAALDAAMLVMLIAPAIYLWIIKPYVIAHEAALHQDNVRVHRDSLTELPNPRLLVEFLEKLLPVFVRKKLHKLYGALLFIDLDGIKDINDERGHNAGDAVLVEVAGRLKSLLRTEDIVSRIGADEFVIVLEQLDIEEHAARSKALAITRRIQRELVKVIGLKAMILQIDSSISLRFLTSDLTGVDAVLKDADTAIYRARKAGKGCIVVSGIDDPVDNVIRRWPVQAGL